MEPIATQDTNTEPIVAQDPPKRRRWYKRPTVMISAAFLVGTMLGSAGGASNTAAKLTAAETALTAAEARNKQLTQQFAEERVGYTEKIKNLNIDKLALLLQLEECGKALDTAGDGFTRLSDVLDAASRFDVAGMQQATAKVEALSPTLREHTQACRG